MKRIEEDFQSLGLTSEEVSESMSVLRKAAGKEDADLAESEENIDDDVYLSDLMDEDDSDEIDEDFINEYIDGMDDDELDEIGVEAGLSEGFVKLASSSVRKQRRLKMKKWLRTSTGQRSLMKKLRLSKSSAFKIHQKKHERKLKMKGGPRRGYRLTTSMDDESMPSMREELLGNLRDLSESIDFNPEDRFEQFVTAFNHIADLGEVSCMKIVDEDEEAASDILNLTVNAESVLREMEEMGGSLTQEEDAALEETLADAMDSVGEYLSQYGFIGSEDSDMDEDVDDDNLTVESFYDAANELREARGAKTGKSRGTSSKGRLLMTKPMPKKGSSKWGKTHGPSAAKAQINMRKDVRNTEALLGYLKAVKSGKVAPGQALPKNTSKSGKVLSKGARAAKAMKGKGYQGAKKAAGNR